MPPHSNDESLNTLRYADRVKYILHGGSHGGGVAHPGRSHGSGAKLAVATSDFAMRQLEQVRSLDNNFPDKNTAARDSWGLYSNKKAHP